MRGLIVGRKHDNRKEKTPDLFDSRQTWCAKIELKKDKNELHNQGPQNSTLDLQIFSGNWVSGHPRAAKPESSVRKLSMMAGRSRGPHRTAKRGP